jgi:hypothetical protein
MKSSIQVRTTIIACSLFVVSVFVLCQNMFVLSVIAQNNEGILIKIVNSSFAPLSTVEGNQVRVTVNYQVNDGSLEDEKINGIMKIYAKNGTLVHSSSFPEGFIAKKKGGTEVFRTTIKDPSVSAIVANVSFIDFARQNTLSNSETANLTLKGDNHTQSVSNQTGQSIPDQPEPFELQPGDTSGEDELSE